MKIIGLTGGIGSGKSTIAKMFHELGVPVYIADVEAKKMLSSSKIVRRKVIKLLGDKAYNQGSPNREYIANKIFNDPDLLAAMNAIIHPKVASHFKRWSKRQEASYCIKEAAILFENEGYLSCDATILVIAPKEIRIERIRERDNAATEEIEARMRNQWTDKKKIPLATYVIENIALNATKKQVNKLHKVLVKPSV